MKIRAILLSWLFLSFTSFSQIDESVTGAWYAYFWDKSFHAKWGVQGDFQYRDFTLLGDMEQLLLRGGMYHQIKDTDIKVTLGYVNVSNGAYGDEVYIFSENRMYQEALLPQRIKRFFLTHRFRYEQRWIDNHAFRTRYRYLLMMNIPLNQPNLDKGVVYLATSNELFLNGFSYAKKLEIPFFERDRMYAGIGYGFKDNLRLQFAYMNQLTNYWEKGQIQLSLHHKL